MRARVAGQARWSRALCCRGVSHAPADVCRSWLWRARRQQQQQHNLLFMTMMNRKREKNPPRTERREENCKSGKKRRRKGDQDEEGHRREGGCSWSRWWWWAGWLAGLGWLTRRPKRGGERPARSASAVDVGFRLFMCSLTPARRHHHHPSAELGPLHPRPSVLQRRGRNVGRRITRHRHSAKDWSRSTYSLTQGRLHHPCCVSPP